jgi:hypothetical protein
VKSSSIKTRWAVRFGLLPLLFLCLLSLPAKGQTAKVSFSLNQATVEEALRVVFQHGGQYRLPPGIVGGAVTAVVQDVPLETALRLVLRQAVPPLIFRREGDVYVIFALPPPAAPLVERGQSPAQSPPADPYGALRGQVQQLFVAKPGWAQITWERCLLEALAQSRAQNKPVVVGCFGGDFCDGRA